MQLHDLVAANTFFAPPKHGSVHTFRQTKQGETTVQSDHGEHVGDNVLTQYRGNMVKGKVEAVYGTDNGDRRWIVRFADGYTKRCNKQSLLKILICLHRDSKNRKAT